MRDLKLAALGAIAFLLLLSAATAQVSQLPGMHGFPPQPAATPTIKLELKCATMPDGQTLCREVVKASLDRSRAPSFDQFTAPTALTPKCVSTNTPTHTVGATTPTPTVIPPRDACAFSNMLEAATDYLYCAYNTSVTITTGDPIPPGTEKVGFPAIDGSCAGYCCVSEAHAHTFGVRQEQ